MYLYKLCKIQIKIIISLIKKFIFLTFKIFKNDVFSVNKILNIEMLSCFKKYPKSNNTKKSNNYTVLNNFIIKKKPRLII